MLVLSAITLVIISLGFYSRVYVANSGGTPRVNLVQVNLGGFRAKLDNRARGHASASTTLDNGNDNVYLDVSGLYNEMLANPVGCSPAQIWHVGNLIGSAVELVKCSFVKCYSWPYSSDACAKLCKSLFKEYRPSCTPHVLLVRGSKLNHGEPGCRAWPGLVRDWLRANWPTAVYVKNRKDSIHDEFGPIFISVGSGGHSFRFVRASVPLGNIMLVFCLLILMV